MTSISVGTVPNVQVANGDRLFKYVIPCGETVSEFGTEIEGIVYGPFDSQERIDTWIATFTDGFPWKYYLVIDAEMRSSLHGRK